ncbi:MAG: bile acid:sodium symporter [Bacteroidales bacterium]|jgi:BASS family bile acid:Na+ symporter|nr:bile acid:sodium symporter [Bacteroidales bacterium]
MEAFFSTYVLPASLAIIMMGMGLSLDQRDFTNVIRYPKPILAGIFSQIILLPLVTFLLFGFTSLDPYTKVGFILITACAGGSATNLITHILRGNLALSISLTAINSLIILVTLPLIVNLGLIVFIGVERDIHLPFFDTIFDIFVTILIPTFIGMLIRYYHFKLAIKAEKPLKIILPLILLFAFMGIIFFDNKADNNVSKNLSLIPWALLLNFVSMTVVYLFAKYLRLGGKNNFTISIEVGLKNSIIGIFVAKSLLNNNDIAMVSVVYGSITFFSTILFGYIAKRIELLGFRFRKLL